MEYLTVSEIASILKYTDNTVRKMMRDGDLPAVKLGKRKWLVSKTVLQDWLRSKEVGE